MKNKEISNWWAENPMTYGKEHGTTKYEIRDSEINFGSKRFFEEADKRFIDWNKPLHKTSCFSAIFPFEKFKKKKILEIGCGMGFMASLWAKNESNITACDLNPVAINQTKNRFKIYDLKGNIQQEDANKLSFKDKTFDYAYSWGVLHHSPNIELSIQEFFRVLRPGGSFGIMLYNRQSLLHYYFTLYQQGFLHRESKFLTDIELTSRYGDGSELEGNPYTWPVTAKEFRNILEKHSSKTEIRILGTDVTAAFQYFFPGFHKLIPKFITKSWARNYGWSLWASGKKR